jgi:uncharacterized phage protein (TIGR01671 family)
MREIKFRAWDKEKKRWATEDEDGLIIFMDGCLGGVDFACWDGGCTTDQEYMSKYILMQFTGLKDKNGKEIYEGDIVRCPDGWIGTVYWDNDNLQWWAKDHKLSELNKPEVIGNIYENPELLEGK